MRRMSIPWLVALLVVGCSGGVSLEGNGRDVQADEADALDVETARDDAADDGGAICTTEVHWVREPRQIAAVLLLPVLGPESPRVGTTNRLRVDVQMNLECELLGGVEVRLTPGGATDFVQLAAYAWTPRGLVCGRSAPLIPWIVTIPGRGQDNLRVVVTDAHAPGGGLMLEYGREMCSGRPECRCDPGTPPGSVTEMTECFTDCSCAEGLSCLGSVLGPPYYLCLRPCNDFLDCRPTEPCLDAAMDGPAYFCRHAGDWCRSDEDCPPGFGCRQDDTDHHWYCEDRLPLPSDAPCECDDACPAGFLCALARWDPMPAWPACEVPCRRDADCPGARTGLFVCGAAGVCVRPE